MSEWNQRSTIRPSATRSMLIPCRSRCGRSAPSPGTGLVRAPHRQPNRDLVTLGDELVGGDVEVGERGVQPRDDVLEPFQARRLPRRGVVLDEVFGDERVRAHPG
jgi:hypothetical protein